MNNHHMKIHRLQPLFALSLLWVATLFCSASIKAQQVVNGGFEQDAPSSSTYNPGSGWTISNPGAPYIYSNSFGHGTTPYGSQWLFLSGGTESQTISGSFKVGQRYELFIGAADVEGGTLPKLHVTLGGGSTAGQVYSMPQGGSYSTNTPIVFGTYELDFTPTTTGPISISLFGDYPIAIDNVSLVPEPSTWALLGLGLAGAGVVTLRRRHADV